jgi:hypothetical protein
MSSQLDQQEQMNVHADVRAQWWSAFIYVVGDNRVLGGRNTGRQAAEYRFLTGQAQTLAQFAHKFVHYAPFLCAAIRTGVAADVVELGPS